MYLSISSIRYRLTSPQREIWFEQMRHETVPLNIGGYVEIATPIIPTLFEEAINLLIKKHDVLRLILTTSEDEDGLPLQAFLEELTFSLSLHDFSSQVNAEQVAQDWIQRQFSQCFELIGKPLFHYDLIKVADDQYYWLMQYHSMLVDDYSVALLKRSLSSIYTRLATKQAVEWQNTSYFNFIEYDQKYVVSEILTQNRQYWLDKYATTPEPLFNSRYRTQLNAGVIANDSELMTLSRGFYQRLQVFAQAHQVTILHVLLGVLYVYFTRTAQRDDFSVGYATLNRPLEAFQHIAGLFTLITPGYFAFGTELTFATLLQKLRTSIAADVAHPCPISEINKAFSHDVKRCTLFDVSIFYQQFDCDISFNGVPAQTTWLMHAWEQTPLVIYVQALHAQTDIAVRFVYNLAYFCAEDIRALQARLENLLEAVLEQAQVPLLHLPIMTAAEIATLQTWNRVNTTPSLPTTVVDMFEAQVNQTPTSVAVVFAEQTFSYQELNQQANQLAHLLISLDVQADTLVGLCVERSPAMLVGLLGIFKSGAAYLPLDPHYPQAHLGFLLQDSQVSVLLTQQSLLERLPPCQAHVVCLDTHTTLHTQAIHNLPSHPVSDSLAYVIYTSGSTGQPKGVAVEHGALAQHIHAISQIYQIQATDRVLQFASMSFDTALEQCFSTWLNGACVVSVQDNRLAVEALQQLLQTQAITIADLPPAYWQQMLSLDHLATTLPDLHTLILGGETLPLALAQQTRALFPHLTLFNAYGPTEAVITATVYRLPTQINPFSDHVPIGQPRAGTQILILNRHHQIQPIGVVGELCIAGAGLARGYLNQPERTAEKFVTVDIFAEMQRVYKTGDLARWLPEGQLEYLGRVDYQVKLRGFRIELGTIETVLAQHHAVKKAVVVLHKVEENRFLSAYVTLVTDVSPTMLTDWLKKHLPDYMVPASFTVLDTLPLNANGKIDRKALPAPEMLQTGQKIAPRNTLERQLSALWSTILKVNVDSIVANFFDLGGHSLLATQLVSRIRDSFAVSMPVHRVFEYPVLGDMAMWLAQQQGNNVLLPIEPQPKDTPRLLSYAQQRLWFLHQLEGASATFNIAEIVKLTGALAIDALRRTFIYLVARHSSLRSCFVTKEDSATVQEIAPYDPLTVTDLRHLSNTTEQHITVQRLAVKHATQTFDLSQGKLLQLHLLVLDDCEYLLLLNMHHIISDGWSMDILTQEWLHSYDAFSQGRTPDLQPLSVQYSDYAAWQRQWLQGTVLQQQRQYWLEQLSGAPTLLALPTDFPRPAVQSYRGARLQREIDTDLTQQLKELTKQQGCTLFMTLLAVFNLLLYRYTGQNDILIGSPIANRTHSQTENLIGFFVNMLVLRTRIGTAMTSLDLLKQIKQMALGAYAHQDLPFEHLVEQLNPERSLSYSPIFQVGFSLEETLYKPFNLPQLDISSVDPAVSQAKHDLTLFASEHDGKLRLVWEYATDLFLPERIQRMAGHFEVLLRTMLHNPHANIHHLPLLTTAEIQQFIQWNQTDTDYPHTQTIVDLLTQQVAQTPDAIAVSYIGSFGEQQLSYQSLNQQANQLARYLIELGVQANTLVGLCVVRSLDMIVGLLGILKAGGAYLPLDPDYPPERLHFMLQDSQVQVLLTQRPLLEHLPTCQATILCLDDTTPWQNQPRDNPQRRSGSNDLAYVIYTSGSTGKPKGVQLPHVGLTNLALAFIQAFQVNTQSRFLQFASFSFDAAVAEISTTLLSGGTLFISEINDLLSTDFTDFLHQQRITHVILPPSLLSNLPQVVLPTLQNLMVAGESCPASLLAHWAKNRLFINGYGPTETSVCASYAICTPSTDKLPIGKPLANMRIYILDAQHQPLPIGVPGELCVAGIGLAIGYLNRPKLTAERFINVTVFGRQERIYKTGDLACWLADGNLDYLGRIDHQVKLRGFRIETGEIEAVLQQHPLINEAIVVHDAAKNHLNAYFTCVPQTDADDNISAINACTPAILHTHLARALPNYMMPATFTPLDKLPLTPNNKVDRKALPAPDMAIQVEGIAPRTATERALAELWSNLLQIEVNDIEADFFALGGHSLLAIQLVARVRTQFEVDMRLHILFKYPLLRRLAVWIDQQRGEITMMTETDENPAIDLEAEAVLEDSIQPLDNTTGLVIEAPKAVLLTGATGFLGVYLLYELLLQTQADVYCLVRADSIEKGMARLQQALTKQTLWQADFQKRIIPLPGDLSKPLLGLSEAQFEQLAQNIDVIYHSGAEVKALHPYPHLKSTNVLSGLQLLQLATQHKPKPLHFISSIGAVIADNAPLPETIFESDTITADQVEADSYTQSKWVAEQLMLQASARGIPIAIYRPSRVAGHSRTGIWNDDDYLSVVLKGCVKLGTIPYFYNYFEDNMAPVDFASRAIITLSRRPDSLHKTFHITNPHSTYWFQFLQHLRSVGYPIDVVSAKEWCDAVEQQLDSPLLSLLAEQLRTADDEVDTPPVTTDTTLKLDCQHTLAGLAGADIVCPVVDDELLQVYCRYFKASGFFEA